MQSETVPIAALAILLRRRHVHVEARAITNLIGNGIATIVIAKWENACDNDRLQSVLDCTIDAVADEPEGPLLKKLRLRPWLTKHRPRSFR